MSDYTLIVLVGATAIGKTAASIQISKKLSCPVISADSRQFFKEMSIGTAKPNKEEMQGVPHFMIDSHSIYDEINVGKYETEVITLLDTLFQKNKTVVLVGGSGLYIDAVCKGFDELPEADPAVRETINLLLHEKGIEALQSLLKELDPVYYSKVDLQNPQRISRALEVCLTTGKPYSILREGKIKPRNFKFIKIGLNTSRDILYARINNRVDNMMESGLLEEARILHPQKHLNALQTVGYNELFDYLENKTDLKSAIESIKQNTRKFAKRQLTWFRRDQEIKWFEPHEISEIQKFIDSQL
jgi:tRNA dimethylallyltransferase